MTTKSDKVRGVFLSALLVMSVFAGTVAFTGAATAQAGNVEQGQASPLKYGDNAYYWSGQTVWNDSLSSSATIRINHANGTLYDTLATDSEGDFKFSTDGMPGGEYYVTADGSNVTGITGYDSSANEGTFQVRTQDVSASFAHDSVDNAHNTRTLFNLTTRSIGYDVTVTAGGLSSEDLQNIFTGVSTSETDDGIEITNVRQESFATDFTDVSPGNYTFEAEVQDTGATASADINVTEGGDAVSTFDGESVVSDEQGDIATFTVDLENTESSVVSIGSAGVNWKANFTVNDTNDDGEVTLQFNSYKSGSGSVSDFVIPADDDSISTDGDTTLGVHTDFGDGGSPEASGLGSPISSGEYEMITGVAGSEQDVAQLVLSEGSVDSAEVLEYPRTSAGNLPDEASGLLDAAVPGDSPAAQDLAIVEIGASGLYGNDSLTQHHLSTNFNASDVYSLNFTQTNPGANAPPNTFQGNDTREVYFDRTNNTIYAVVDTDENNIAPGDEYQAEFTIHQGSAVTDEALSTNTTFSVEERTLEFTGLNENDVLNVSAGNATIEGETSVAEGTEFRVQVKSDSFVRTSTATVNEDGTFSADFDFSDVSTGTALTVSASSGDASDSVDGEIVEGQEDPGTTTTTDDTTTTTDDTTTTTETTTTTTETTTTETTTEDTTEEMNGETTTTDPGENGSGIPGFGMAVSLVALVAAALLALRRSN